MWIVFLRLLGPSLTWFSESKKKKRWDIDFLTFSHPRFVQSMSKFALGTYKIVWEDHHSNIANSLGLDYILMASLQLFPSYLVS